MGKHIFVGNSNIFGGAQRAAQVIEPQVIWLAVRVYYRNFFQLIEGANQVLTREMAGSVPPGNDALWNYARIHGYSTDLLQRVPRDDGRLVEQAVDELLHLKIANTLLDYNSPQTLVIASGDGSLSDMGTSFPMQAERALKRDWSVEVWSWEEQPSNRYHWLSQQYVGRVNVQTLDQYYRSITFVKGGTYAIDDANVTLQDRIVSPL